MEEAALSSSSLVALAWTSLTWELRQNSVMLSLPHFLSCSLVSIGMHAFWLCFAHNEISPRIAATSQFLSYSSPTTVSASYWLRQNRMCAAIGQRKIILPSYWLTQNSAVLSLVRKCLEDSQVSEWTNIMTFKIFLINHIYENTTGL